VAAAGGDGNSSLYHQFKPSQFNYLRQLAQTRTLAPNKANPPPFSKKKRKNLKTTKSKTLFPGGGKFN
jgi:hypothetical protein